MEYDPVRQVTVLAGGDNACRTMESPVCALADTWEWRDYDPPATCDPPPP
ncbi:MAG TPA: hypothetical protein VNO26_06145 [Candidatus Limnocylindria bacterium]|nr:hypothetical protein [Candidatus Limnocylindria bacterium]